MTIRLYDFADYNVGEKGVTVSRTVGEADINNFASLTGDYSQLHMDRHYTEHTMFKGRIAHGLLGASLATGMLSMNAPHLMGRGNPKAYFYSFEINYRQVIKLGDTIKTTYHVIEKYDDPQNEDVGVVRTSFQVVNQDGNSVFDGSITIKVGKKTSDQLLIELKPGDPWTKTEFIPDTDKVYYLEDYTPDGEGGETEGRTITEADVVHFAGLTGDYNPLHVDAEYAKQGVFGERIAHGMLCFNIAFAYWLREWMRFPMPNSGIAGHLNDKVHFLSPVKIGDTIRCRYKTLSTRVSKRKPELGLITFGVQVINQRNEVVQEGSVIMMMPSHSTLHLLDFK